MEKRPWINALGIFVIVFITVLIMEYLLGNFDYIRAIITSIAIAVVYLIWSYIMKKNVKKVRVKRTRKKKK